METLGQRLARGDQAAFAELYDACADRCHHYVVLCSHREGRRVCRRRSCGPSLRGDSRSRRPGDACRPEAWPLPPPEQNAATYVTRAREAEKRFDEETGSRAWRSNPARPYEEQMKAVPRRDSRLTQA